MRPTLTLENLRPLLQQGFGKDVANKHAAERKRDVAVLKILELVVAGQISQRAGEDYFKTICRVIGGDVSDVKAGVRTKKAINEAVAAIVATSRWRTGPAELVEMRQWGAKRAVVRAILLLTVLERTIGPAEMAKWLEFPNPNLNKQTPVHFLKTGGWAVLADFMDDMLTGSPT